MPVGQGVRGVGRHLDHRVLCEYLQHRRTKLGRGVEVLGQTQVVLDGKPELPIFEGHAGCWGHEGTRRAPSSALRSSRKVRSASGSVGNALRSPSVGNVPAANVPSWIPAVTAFDTSMRPELSGAHQDSARNSTWFTPLFTHAVLDPYLIRWYENSPGASPTVRSGARNPSPACATGRTVPRDAPTELMANTVAETIAAVTPRPPPWRSSDAGDRGGSCDPARRRDRTQAPAPGPVRVAVETWSYPSFAPISVERDARPRAASTRTVEGRTPSAAAASAEVMSSRSTKTSAARCDGVRVPRARITTSRASTTSSSSADSVRDGVRRSTTAARRRRFRWMFIAVRNR